MPPCLSAEVWLGPAEGTHFVTDGRSREQLIRIARLSSSRKDRTPNHLVLSVCGPVSGDIHAKLRLTGGRVFLSDMESANGTFAHGQKVEPGIEFELGDGDIFLASLTPIQVTILPERPPERDAPRLPVPVEEFSDLSVAELLQSARECASRRGERYIDSRHLAEAILRSGSASVLASLKVVGVSAESLAQEVWYTRFFLGDTDWLSEVLTKPVGIPGDISGAVVTPKVAVLLRDALTSTVNERLARRPEEISRYLFSALMLDQRGAVGRWLSRYGIPAPVDQEGDTQPPGFKPQFSGSFQASPMPVSPHGTSIPWAPAPPPAPPPPALSPPAPPPPAPPINAVLPVEALGFPPVPVAEPVLEASIPIDVPYMPSAPAASFPEEPVATRVAPPEEPRDSGPYEAVSRLEAPPEQAVLSHSIRSDVLPVPSDSVVDHRVHELAGELMDYLESNRFSLPSERRQRASAWLNREISGFPKKIRHEIVRRLGDVFPVVEAGAMPESPAAALRQRIAELKRQEEQLKAAPEPKKGVSGYPWAEGTAEGKAVIDDKDRKAFLEVLRFALAMEAVLLDILRTLLEPGNTSPDFRLPGYPQSLKEIVQAAARGTPPSERDVEDYLKELRFWQVACLGAFMNAPRAWFEKIWKRISPSLIEAYARGPVGIFSAPEEKFWQAYRAAVKDLAPDVVKEQIQRQSAELARADFKKLKNQQETSR